MWVKHRSILFYVFLNPWFLPISIALTVTNTFPACLLDLHVGRINLATFSAALTSCCSGLSGFSMTLSGCISDSTSASQLSLLWFGLSKSPLQLSQFSVSEMLWGELTSSGLTGWWSNYLIRQTFDSWIRFQRGRLQTKLVAKKIFLTI